MSNVYVYKTDCKVFNFPAGEVSVRLNEDTLRDVSTIVAHIQNSDNIMQMLLLNDALRRVGQQQINLLLPYVPYSRQDRVCNSGEALSIKVFCDLVNSCNFNSVFVMDCHSDVTLALLNNVQHAHQSVVFSQIEKDWANTIIISPDAGALKKAEQFAKDRGAKGVVVANKKRNVSIGDIEYVRLTESVANEDVFVVDDICEGGGTFLLLAEQLQEAKSKEIAVSHGIFSRGTEVLTNVYDKVYTTNSYHPKLESKDNLVVFKII